MAEEAALNFEDAIELGKFKVNLFPFREFFFHRISHSFESSVAQTHAVRHLPMWFPGAEFRRTAAHWRERLALAVSAPFERVKSDVVCHVPGNALLQHADSPRRHRGMRNLVSQLAAWRIALSVSRMSTSNGRQAHSVRSSV